MVQNAQTPASNEEAKEAEVVLTEQYIEMAHIFCDIAAGAGCDIVPYGDAKALHFSRLSLEEKGAVLQGFGSYVQLCQSVLAEGRSVNDDRHMLWRALTAMRLRPPSDMFETITEDDFLEVFLYPQNTQIFRCFRYFYVCSYTLDDLLSRPWWELFHRDEAVLKRIYDHVEKVMALAKPGRYPFSVGPHSLDEIDSARRYHCVVENKYMVPLYDQSGSAVAFLNVMRAHEVRARAGASSIDILGKIRRDRADLDL